MRRFRGARFHGGRDNPVVLTVRGYALALFGALENRRRPPEGRREGVRGSTREELLRVVPAER
jgi:hypothetical protein